MILLLKQDLLLMVQKIIIYIIIIVKAFFQNPEQIKKSFVYYPKLSLKLYSWNY